MKAEDLKNKYNEKLKSLNLEFVESDSVCQFLLKDHVIDAKFEFFIVVLPFELANMDKGLLLQKIAKEKKAYEYDPFYSEWEKHLIGYWEEKNQLLDYYITPVDKSISPLQIFTKMKELMIKIEKRSLILNHTYSIVEQKHRRISGDNKEYLFIRSYWIDKNGTKSRMITRPIGSKYENVEQEIGQYFRMKGYSITLQPNSYDMKYDMIIERNEMKFVVEIKLKRENFERFFIFSELIGRFENEYS